MSQLRFPRAAALLLLVGAACGGSRQGATAASSSPAPRSVSTAPRLIPRELLLGNPERTRVEISPDGNHLSFLAPHEGVLNVWVAPAADLGKARPVTADRNRPVRIYFWAHDNRHILYLQDQGGDEDWHVHSVDIASGEDRDLTPMKKIRAEVLQVSERHPDHVVLGINDRNPELHDAYKVDIRTGERVLLARNDGHATLVFDDDFRLRLASKVEPDGGITWYQPRPAPRGKRPRWQQFLDIAPEDAESTEPVGFDKTGDKAYFWDSRNRDTRALVQLDMKNGEAAVLAEDTRADGSDLVMHPTEKTVQAVAFTHARREWKVLDPTIETDMQRLSGLTDGDIQLVARTLDHRTWVVAARSDTMPLRYYLWDRDTQRERFLFSSQPALEGQPLAKMYPVSIRSRDGLELVSYLSLPAHQPLRAKAVPRQPLPMVLLVHGGPWARDHWGFHPEHQLLANRGYAVLSVNYRGSTGFGKRFTNAADREWAGKMHQDLIDAVEWAVAQGVARKDRICIMGGSYGGYATLVGLTMTPEVFACGVDIVGPSSLATLIRSVPSYWRPMISLFHTKIGNPDDPDDAKFLAERSPLTHAGRIRRPLLIAQGANDPRVKQAESDQIVAAMRKDSIPVTYVLYPDEGHGFHRPQNRVGFYAVTEAFLSRHLGGRVEPMSEQTFAGSTIQVLEGRDGIPGLPASVGQPPRR